MMIPSWILGCIISLCGSLCANVGVNIQKYSFNNELTNNNNIIYNNNNNNNAGNNHHISNSDNQQRRAYYLQPYWLIGLFLVISGGISDFIALAITAQTIIAAISSINLVINLLFAGIYLHEQIYINDICGTILLVFGSILAVVYGNHDDQSHTLDELVSYLHNIYFIIFVLFLLLIVLPVCSIVIVKYQPIHTQLESLYIKQQLLIESINNHAEDHSHAGNVHHTNDSNTIGGSMDINVVDKSSTALLNTYEELIDRLELQYHNRSILLPISYCTLSGICASFAMLFSKCSSELINTTIHDSNQFIYISTYLYLLATILSVIGQLDLFARALLVYDCCTVVPVFKGVFLICSTIAGLCYFQEFNQFNTVQSIMFTTGILINITGIVVLSNRQHIHNISNNISNTRRSVTPAENTMHNDITEPLLSDRSLASTSPHDIQLLSSSDDELNIPKRSQSAITLSTRSLSHTSARYPYLHNRQVSNADKLTMIINPSLERTVSIENIYSPHTVVNTNNNGTPENKLHHHHKQVSTTQIVSPDSRAVKLTNR